MNSGYCQSQISEIVLSSLKGMKLKEERNKKVGKRYLSADETLPDWLRKKLVENTNWYKERKKEDRPPEEETSGIKKCSSNYINTRRANKRKRKEKLEDLIGDEKEKLGKAADKMLA